MRTPAEYIESLRDERVLWYRGKRVGNLLAEPDLRVAVEHSCVDFALTADPAHRDLAVARDETGLEYHALYQLPESPDDLIRRSRLVELGSLMNGTIPSVKEVGADALLALLAALEGEERERAVAFWDRCRRDDLVVSVAQTDVKGDRSKAPHEQADPDLYVHVVDQSDQGIVVRGAKAHTSLTPNCNEIVVLPTRAMGAADADWAVSFAIPADTPGLSMYVSGYSAGERHPWEYPISSRHKMLETLTVFENVFVPWERVFLFRRPELAGPLALRFVDFHRFTAVSYKLPLLDALVGAAAEIARMNGVLGAGHIKEKLTQLVIYAETVRTLTEAAAIRGRTGAHGICRPDSGTTNLAKYTFASRYHDAVRMVQECAGALLVTGPGGDDWDSPEVRPVLEKYFGAAAPAGERLAMMNMISDLTVREYGGYQTILAVHAEGSIEAEKMQILREYNPNRAVGRARWLARLDENPPS
ncbi:MAG: 4-hydroxyphenylacetate 3-hydroxylase N-terminal domain-containing protein [Actinomycetota bacterium]|nr:4-hydroxyphenylacetate 3-hydroxylase N-terminal domain-containing protein [Actinomycetota bacterium]